jgi:AcrR family transcriptional regulator
MRVSNPVDGHFFMSKKVKTMASIAEASDRLIRESGGELPTARDLSKATGFSAATVYFHFGSIGGVIRHLVRVRMSAFHDELEQLIAAHDPKIDPRVLLDELVDRMFANALKYNPTLVRKVYKIALEHSDRITEMDASGDRLLVQIRAAIANDETGVFKTLTNDEVVFLFRGLVAIIRSPLMERSPFFGTTPHVHLAKTYMHNMFLSKN